MQDDKRTEETKTEQEKKEYIARRKSECYEIYEKERDRWNNVEDLVYSEVRDVCIVKYKSSDPARTEEECKEITKNIANMESDYFKDIMLNNYFDCLANWFSKEF